MRQFDMWVLREDREFINIRLSLLAEQPKIHEGVVDRCRMSVRAVEPSDHAKLEIIIVIVTVAK